MGFNTIRVHLPWDAFAPSHRQLSRARFQDFESLLNIAVATEMRIVPVLFAQSFGDVLPLPRYAVDRNGRRRGVRVTCEGHVEIGGPRDLYADPLMIEASVTLLEELLGGFANHPGIAAWDLGHDPATTLRPARTAHLNAWVEELAGRVHARQDLVRLTLGVGDVLGARGVRLAPLAALVDRLDVALMPQRLSLGQKWPELDGLGFVVQLAQRLAGSAIGVQMCIAASDDAPDMAAAPISPSPRDPGVAPCAVAADYVDAAINHLIELGCTAVGLWPTHQLGRRALAAPPCDRFPSLAMAGVFSADNQANRVAEPWRRAAQAETAIRPSQPWPNNLDIEAYYQGLPGAAHDLYEDWRGGRAGRDQG